MWRGFFLAGRQLDGREQSCTVQREPVPAIVKWTGAPAGGPLRTGSGPAAQRAVPRSGSAHGRQRRKNAARRAAWRMRPARGGENPRAPGTRHRPSQQAIPAQRPAATPRTGPVCITRWRIKRSVGDPYERQFWPAGKWQGIERTLETVSRRRVGASRGCRFDLVCNGQSESRSC